MAIKLRVVSQEMLDRSAHALALYALDVTDRNAGGEEGVFAEVLKVSSVHWSTVDVYPGRQEEVHAFRASVASELGPLANTQAKVEVGLLAAPAGKR